jgi:hypothetical protein
MLNKRARGQPFGPLRRLSRYSLSGSDQLALAISHTSPFYSALRGDALVGTWHDNEACPAAQRIPATDRRRGMGYLRQRCQHCAELVARPQGLAWLLAR